MEIYGKDQLLPEVVTATLYECSSLCNASQLKLWKQKKKRQFVHINSCIKIIWHILVALHCSKLKS